MKRSAFSRPIRRVWPSLLLAIVAWAGCGDPGPQADDGTVASPEPEVDGRLLFTRGQRARLELRIEVDGSADRTEPNGASDRWSTQRVFTVAMDLVARRPTQISGLPDGPDARRRSPIPAASEEGVALQKQAAACGEDLSCRMRVSQKMMSGSEPKTPPPRAIDELPLRFQEWTLAKEPRLDGRATVSTRTEELSPGSEKERKQCSLSAEYTAADLHPGASLVVDAASGIGYIAGVLSLGVQLPIETRCETDSGGRRGEETQRELIRFLPVLSQPKRVYAGDAIQGGGDLIAQGRQDLHGSFGQLPRLGAEIPARVRLSWKVTKL